METNQVLTIEQKQRAFKEYFTVKQAVNVNVVPFEPERSLPSAAEFEHCIPYSFRLASDVSSLDAHAVRSLRNLGGVGDDLVDYLKAQARKIDLIMSHILVMEDTADNRLYSECFGGGGISIVSPEPMEPGQLVELKIFLTDEAAAIFCYGEVIGQRPCEVKQQHFIIDMYYARIREEDREIIVRASLHQQAKQLKRKAEQKQS